MLLHATFLYYCPPTRTHTNTDYMHSLSSHSQFALQQELLFEKQENPPGRPGACLRNQPSGKEKRKTEAVNTFHKKDTQDDPFYHLVPRNCATLEFWRWIYFSVQQPFDFGAADKKVAKGDQKQVSWCRLHRQSAYARTCSAVAALVNMSPIKCWPAGNLSAEAFPSRLL